MTRTPVETQRLIKLIRDGILFVAGLAGIAYETLIQNGDKPTLLVLFGAMVGLPAFLRTDEKKKDVETPASTESEKT